MKRRDFIYKGIAAGLAAGIGLSTKSFGESIGNGVSHEPLPYDLVAIKGGEADAMFDRAIASLGGMKNFVKKNQTVVVKPNIGWDKSPEFAADTNPKLVARIIEHCYRAGAKKVYVFDNTCDNWEKCYSNSGIGKAVKDSGGEMVTGNSESMYHKIAVNRGKRLKNANVHELIMESDVFINVPILKCHNGAILTIGMKNLMGIVWDREYWHKNDLQQCIADFPTYRKPDLTIVDAYRVLKMNGPRGISVNDVITMKAQIISADIVAADTAAAKMYGLDPLSIGHIVKAQELGLGTMNLEKLKINRILV